MYKGPLFRFHSGFAERDSFTNKFMRTASVCTMDSRGHSWHGHGFHIEVILWPLRKPFYTIHVFLAFPERFIVAHIRN